MFNIKFMQCGVNISTGGVQWVNIKILIKFELMLSQKDQILTYISETPLNVKENAFPCN